MIGSHFLISLPLAEQPNLIVSEISVLYLSSSEVHLGTYEFFVWIFSPGIFHWEFFLRGLLRWNFLPKFFRQGLFDSSDEIYWTNYLPNKYRKVASSILSWLVAHSRIFRLFMKGKFDAYLLWSLAKTVQNWIVDRSTARDFTICEIQSA